MSVKDLAKYLIVISRLHQNQTGAAFLMFQKNTPALHVLKVLLRMNEALEVYIQ